MSNLQSIHCGSCGAGIQHSKKIDGYLKCDYCGTLNGVETVEETVPIDDFQPKIRNIIDRTKRKLTWKDYLIMIVAAFAILYLVRKIIKK